MEEAVLLMVSFLLPGCHTKQLHEKRESVCSELPVGSRAHLEPGRNRNLGERGGGFVSLSWSCLEV